MSKKTKSIFALVCIACAAASLAVGCKIGEPTGEEFLTDKKAFKQIVTYYANGGYFNDKDNVITKDMYYPENSYVIVDFENTSNISIDRTGGYIFEGWYFVEQDDGGKPVFEDEANKIYKLTDRELDGNYRIQPNEHLYVAAKWGLDFRLDVVLVCDGTAKDAAGNGYSTGDVVYSKEFASNGTTTLKDESPWNSADHTFAQYYLDENCTKPYNGEKINKPAGEDAENPKIYAKYIEGKWTVVKTPSQVKDMFNDSESTNAYYIFNDIDCSATGIQLNPGSFNLTIEGNGHTIKGLTFKETGISGNDKYALFGSIGNSASIKNLTLSDITVTVTVKTGMPSLYLVCYGKEGDNDCFENFVIDGAQMSVSYPTGDEGIFIDNIQSVGGVYESDNWLYGGVKDESGNQTDQAFLAKFGGVTVNDAQLTVNGEKVA